MDESDPRSLQSALNGSTVRAARTNCAMTAIPQSTKMPSRMRAPKLPSENRLAMAQLPAKAAPNTSALIRIAALTTVSQPAYDLGHESGRLLLNRLNGYLGSTRTVVLPTSVNIRASSAPKPQRRGFSSTVNSRPVFCTDAATVETSSGTSERRSMTSHSMPFYLACSAAASASQSIAPHAMTVTSLPSRATRALPISTTGSVSGTSPLAAR